MVVTYGNRDPSPSEQRVGDGRSLRADRIIVRKILFFPFGNNVDFASFYLEQANPEKPKSDWYACVQFALVMWNPQDPSLYMFLRMSRPPSLRPRNGASMRVLAG